MEAGCKVVIAARLKRAGMPRHRTALFQAQPTRYEDFLGAVAQTRLPRDYIPQIWCALLLPFVDFLEAPHPNGMAPTCGDGFGRGLGAA